MVSMERLARGEIPSKVMVQPSLSLMSPDTVRPTDQPRGASASMPTVMDEEGRAALLDFFSEVFGWTEGDNSTEKGNPLILYTGRIRASSSTCCRRRTSSWSRRTWTTSGWRCPPWRRWSEILERVKVYQGKDDRVRVTEVGAMVTHHEDKEYTLTNAYIWFLLPLWIELQHVERRTKTGTVG